MKTELAAQIKRWGKELGFQQVGISHGELGTHVDHLKTWLAKNFHGSMHYMERHLPQRTRIDALVPGSFRVICVRMNYLPPNAAIHETLNNPEKAFISRYALGRDYHKLIRKRLSLLAKHIESVTGPLITRAFTDSAPVLERAHAENAGIGWIGKHTCLINRDAGSWFFLGELYVSCDLPVDEPVKNHCGTCTACITVCPTQAIIAPYQLDARRCISYLTIEHKEAIPEELRSLMGNRIYGCDDCQLVCPWNRFAKLTTEKDFHARHHLDTLDLITAFLWDEKEFQQKTLGSAMSRITHAMWLRNVAIALGNGEKTAAVLATLRTRENDPHPLIQEHVRWALDRLLGK